ncbi:MAG: hypothetical protein A4E53_03689 [Pelotomaculum sp. PtaB.Bin104]|nr:MAG: hypothetical protein A4E53_03689 [Pelotomaculum sp. PtaB.Bin104]
MSRCNFILILLLTCVLITSGCSHKYQSVNSPSNMHSRNWLFSNQELNLDDIRNILGIPVIIENIDESDPASKISTIPYLTMTNSYLKKTFERQVTKQENESVFDFARRVALELRTKANIGIPYMVTEDERKVYDIFGSSPVLCSDIAAAFQEIMRQNGIWVHTLGLRYKNNPWDSHTTNEIYDPQKDKWIVVDVTFAGVFQNNEGTILNAAEIQANPANAKFVPFDPSAGYEKYYISPLTKLYNYIQYNNDFVNDYMSIVNSKDSPYRFHVEKLKTDQGWLYFWRNSPLITFLTSPNLNYDTIRTSIYYQLDLQNVCAYPSLFAHKTISTARLIKDDINSTNDYIEISVDNGEGGGLSIDPKLVPGKLYIVDVEVKTQNGYGQKVWFSYQDQNTKQWSVVEGDEWHHLSYLISPKSSTGQIYIYNDKPVQFALKSLVIREIL